MLRSVSFVNYDGAFQKNKMQRSKPRLIHAVFSLYSLWGRNTSMPPFIACSRLCLDRTH